jgi:23S rRNA (adenine2503-C2)-methyltransferase
MDLHGMRPEDLVAHLAAQGVVVALPEARRVLAWALSHGHVADGRAQLDGMVRPVSRAVRAAVAAHTTARRPEVVERVEDGVDGSVRYLFAAEDGARFEAVRIPLHKPGRFSVCLSSQVGCAMGCVFCATGRLGLARNLSAAEIVGAFCAVRDEAPGRVTGAVFMGQGEPLHNYEAVMQAASVLADPNGGRISADGITVSTVGLVPQIRRFTAEGRPFRLIVSLTSALPERRAALLPVAGRIPLEELAAALRAHHAVFQDRVTVAWVLMGGVNDGPEEVEALRALFGDVPLRVNLIDVNDDRPGGARRATAAERAAFMDALQVLRAPVVRRYSVGAAQASACGMLAARPPVGEAPHVG